MTAMDSINVTNDPLAVLALLGGALVAALVLLYLLALLARRTWAWVKGGNGKAKSARTVSPVQEPLLHLSSSPAVTTADFLVVKSNLLTVIRQIEDLERRLKYGDYSPSGNVTELKRA